MCKLSKNLCPTTLYNLVKTSALPLTMSSDELEAAPPGLVALHKYFPASSWKVSGIMRDTRPSRYDISKSGPSARSLPSLYHLIVGSGLPKVTRLPWKYHLIVSISNEQKYWFHISPPIHKPRSLKITVSKDNTSNSRHLGLMSPKHSTIKNPH